MEYLNPTLWRTCKMLAGRTRIQLLRQIHQQGGRSVCALGEAVGIKRAYASQELRRIQSRGLLKSRRLGLPLVYRMEADPQVPTAAPLLKAIQAALVSRSPEHDLEMCSIANGLAHERRIDLARVLLAAPQTPRDLRRRLNLSGPALAKHLRTLMKSGFTVRVNRWIHFKVPAHPLARALVKALPPVR